MAFVGQCSIVRASTWLADVARKDGTGTDLTNRYDYLRLFEHSHRVDKPWNPSNLKLKGVDAYLPIYRKSALYFLDMAYGSLLETTPSMRKFEDAVCTAQQAAGSSPRPDFRPQPLSEEERKEVREAMETLKDLLGGDTTIPISRPPPLPPKTTRPPLEEPAGVGSVLSLNLYLRILLHLIPGIHQPLQTVQAFSKAFPRGDRGGKNITMILRDGTVTTLHGFWDSGGNQYTKDARDVTDEELFEEARKIMGEFPITQMIDRFTSRLLAPNFLHMADESYRLATDFAYSELNLEKLKITDLPYRPTPAYIEQARVLVRQQIALAGHRLAQTLETVAKYLPHPGSSETD